MEILFYRYGSICEPDLISVFESIGLNVITETIEIQKKNLMPSERIKILSTLIDTHQFTFVFTINFFPSISDLCQIYKIPYVCWVVDSPVMELFSNSLKNPVNYVFTFDRAQYELLHPYNEKGVFHLPLATNVTRWDNTIHPLTDSDTKKYSCDISFIGSLYSEKDPYLLTKNTPPQICPSLEGYVDGIIAAQNEIYGASLLEKSLSKELISFFKAKMPALFYNATNQLMNTDTYVCAHQILGMHAAYLERVNTLKRLGEHFSVDLYTLSDTSVFSKCPKIHVKGSAKTLTEMPKIFHLSKINLNMTIRPIQKGLSLRIWDILGCGGFLMCNLQEELFDHFIPGQDLETFSSIEELVDKCEFYLSHEDIRQKIALSGYEKVKAHHTYALRMKSLFETVVTNME